METLARRAGRLDWIWLLVCGGLSSTAIVAASSRLGGTFDEHFYLKAGLERWRTGSTFELMRRGTMPLPVDVETLPLRIAELLCGRPWDLDAEYPAALACARPATLVFWWLLLIYGQRIAGSLGGPWAGRIAVAGLALEPNLLAHAGLATTDIALAACLLVFGWHYQRGRDGPWWRRVGAPAVCVALAVLAKASALVFVPLIALAVEASRLWDQSTEVRHWSRLKDTLSGLRTRSLFRESIAIASIALILVYLYCGSDWKPHDRFVSQTHALPEGAFRAGAVWFAENLTIFNNAGVGLWYQIHHNLKGHGSYLLGESSPSAIWYYFPAALCVKLPIPLLAAPFALVFVARRHLFNWATLGALLLVLFSLNCRVQIGVRMQLPLITLGIIGLSAAAANSLPHAKSWTRRLGAATILLAGSWMTVSTTRYWPDHLTYINELWNQDRPELVLSDSNLDWGQGLPELDEWRMREGVSEIGLWYFGSDPAALQPPFRYLPLHTIPISDERALAERAPTRYLAVGTTILHGSYIKEPAWLLRRLRETPPRARTRTFLIFDMGPAG